MDCAPSAAARLLIATVRPDGSVAPWRDADPGTRDAAGRLATAARLDALLSARLGAEAPAALKERATREVALARLAWVEGARVLEGLEAKGCQPIALKGGDLSARAWPIAWAALPDRAMLRAASDLDVLVPDAAASGDAMRALGYRGDAEGAAHHRRWKRDDGFAFSVEVHHDLFDRPHGLTLDLEAQRVRAVLCATPLGDSRRVLSGEDAFIHVAAHAVYSDALSDAVATLRAPLDLIALVSATRLDVSTVAHRAQASGLGSAVSLAAEWTAGLLGEGAAFFTDLGAALPLAPGWRAALARRRTLRLASGATAGSAPTRTPFTATRALLAPTSASALAMLLEGARRRR